MHAWEQIQKTVDFIEEKMAEEIKIGTLAKVAGLSQFYFQRLFKRLVKKPVNEYIKLRRLARASEMLLEENKRILDVALDCGFSSHETFTRAFKEAYGITPEDYRNAPVRLNQLAKPELSLNYTLIDEDVPLITDSIVLEMTRRKIEVAETYMGFSAQVPISQAPVGETTGIDVPGQLWESFYSRKADIPTLLPDGTEVGVSMMEGAADGTFTYFVGGAVKPDTPVNGELMTWELPADEYVLCCFEAENFTELTNSALGKAMNYLFGTWLANRGLTTQPFSVEKYYKTTTDAAYMEIWVIPVKQKGTEKS
ncbi:AraC family transcriptional regulator [Salipaludibacillus sp. LMS25]|jgi:AraC family transcriptional regulator|uniref:AraC family transcriptional regulator n=1 Tax=Salipaludibacillus sp. LMS25 TaxID=2924031 RepID=UPI0020D1D15E|nr:AraC family transcriptional regulator [Salipaludibacillus sp. LMS25]UTR13779.1 AraC family transcriptional regulator [Salipaludibacillus sp. LMS25]